MTLSIAPKQEYRLLGVILIALHLTLWWDATSVLSRLFLLIHFIAFLLWQPLWGKRESLNPQRLIALFIFFGFFLSFMNLWLITLWQLVLIGLLGGRDLVKPADRTINLTAIVFLTIELFIVNVHVLFFTDSSIHSSLNGLQWLFLNYGLLLIPGCFFLISADDSIEYRHNIDFFHGLTLTLIIIILMLGSLVMMYHANISYPLAVFQMTLGVAFFILLISWIWVIFAGAASIEQMWVQHLFNLGSSFEQWLSSIAQPHNYKNMTSKQFLDAGFEYLATLPWIAGIEWSSSYSSSNGTLGQKTKHTVVIDTQFIETTVYAYHRVGGTHYFYIKLLIQLLEHFHQAKLREETFAKQAHLQAVYETGSKLTHDIKNLLQVLYGISDIIQNSQTAELDNSTEATQRVLDTQIQVQKQMPRLTQQLKRTLDKLEHPGKFSYAHVPVSLWWENVKARYRRQSITFYAKIDSENTLVPEDLFDNVVENLLQNALMKRRREPDLHIEVSLSITKSILQLLVSDDGSAIPPEIAENLLREPVQQSRDGLGIGLYNAAKQLIHTDYNLLISKNEAGLVCFELVSREALKSGLNTSKNG
jgi:signal transduction histidine kinase